MVAGSLITLGGFAVALRKESVDRNTTPTWTPTGCAWVALRKESVDRNGLFGADTLSY